MPSETFLFADNPEPVIKQPHSDAQLLLDWLQKWNKPVVSTRDIRIYGPLPLRDREAATSSVEILLQHGWLAPTKTRQRNYRIWEIVRKGPTLHPTVAT